MELAFKTWLTEQGPVGPDMTTAHQASALLQKELQQLQNNPQKIVDAMRKLGVDPEQFKTGSQEDRINLFNQLTMKLEGNPQVQRIMDTVNKMKNQPLPEWVIEEGFWGVVKTLASPLVYLGKKALETISFVLQPIPGVGGLLAKAFAPWRELEKDLGKGRVQYTGMLLLTFLLSPMLLGIGVATGNPGAVAAGVSTAGYSLAWWAHMLFGKAVMEPFLKLADG